MRARPQRELNFFSQMVNSGFFKIETRIREERLYFCTASFIIVGRMAADYRPLLWRL